MSVGSREREGRPCPGWTPGSARHRPKNRLKGLRLCAEDTRSCSQSEVHNSRLHRHKFLLLSNEGDQTAWFCLQIFQRAPSCPSEPSCGSDPTAVPRAAASWGRAGTLSAAAWVGCLSVPGTDLPKPRSPAHTKAQLSSICRPAGEVREPPCRREPGIVLQQLQAGCGPRDKSYLFKKPQRPIISARKYPWIFTREQG